MVKENLIINSYNNVEFLRSNNQIDLSLVREQVIKDLTKNPERQYKYESFINSLKKLKTLWRLELLKKPKTRAFITEHTYYATRFLDDLVDRDIQANLDPSQTIEYIQQRLDALQQEDFCEQDI